MMRVISKQTPAARRRRGDPHGERGMALVFALLGLTLLSMLAASLLFVTSAGSFASLSFKSQMQASFAANTGVQKALDWFRTYYAPTYLDVSTGINATYTAYTPFTTQPPTYNTNPVKLGSGSNFPDTTNAVQNSFAALNSSPNNQITMGNTTGSYTLSAQLMSHNRYQDMNNNTIITERWDVTVIGRVAGALGDSTVQETATIERMFVPLFKDAIRGQCDVNLGGSILTDSYFSTAGPYGGSNLFTGVAAQASVGSNSFISASGCAGTINGNAYYGDTTGGCTGSAQFNCAAIVTSTGGQIQQAPGVPFPPIIPDFTDKTNMGTNDCQGNGDRTLSPNGNPQGLSSGSPPAQGSAAPAPGPHYRTCDPTGNAIIDLCVPGGTTPQYFFFNTLKIGAQNKLQVVHRNASGGCDSTLPCSTTNPCAPVKLYVNQDLNLGGGGVVGQVPNDPTRFSVYYSGTNEAQYAGNTAFYGTIYARNATLKLAGGTKIYGAVTAQNVTDQGNVEVHYDLSLQSSTGEQTTFRIVNQTRNVF